MKSKIILLTVTLLVGLLAACASSGTTAQDGDSVQTSEPDLTQAPSTATEPASPDQEGEADDQQDQALEDDGMQLVSSEFEEGQPIPQQYSCDGEDISPPLTWSGVPEGSESFALIMDDPDAPVGTWDHWLLYNIPADKRGLEQAIPSQDALEDGSQHGQNSWGNLEYGGPCPPGGTHRYILKFFALDQLLELEPGATKEALLETMEGHILAQTELVGTYSR